jgi:hypothetical protein
MTDGHPSRAPSFLDPDKVELLRSLTRLAQAAHPPSAWPHSIRRQMENVRNFARGKVKRPKPLLQAELAAYFLTFPDETVPESFRELRQRLTGGRLGDHRTRCGTLLPGISDKTLTTLTRYHGRYVALRRSILRDRIVISVINVRHRRDPASWSYFLERTRTRDRELFKAAGVVIPASGVLYFLGSVRHSTDMRLMAVREPPPSAPGGRPILTGLLLATSASRVVFTARTLLHPVPARKQVADLIGIFDVNGVPPEASRWVAHFEKSTEGTEPLTLEAGDI